MAEIIYAMIDLMSSPCSFYKQYFLHFEGSGLKKVLCPVVRLGND